MAAIDLEHFIASESLRVLRLIHGLPKTWIQGIPPAMKRHTAGLVVALLSIAGCDDKKDSDKSDAKSAEAKGDDAPSGFTAYKLKSMSSEARVQIRMIADAASAYYMEERLGSIGEAPTQELPPAAPVTPPKGSCCKQDKGQCPADPKLWEGEGWTALNFQPMEPIRYSYAFEVDGDKFTVHAYGDLDCDGTFSDYALSGHIEDGSVVLDSEPKITDELEQFLINHTLSPGRVSFVG